MTDRLPLAGVIGRPIGHSRSPALHRHWLARYGLPGDYTAFEVAEDDLAEVVRMLPKMGVVGVNVTVPHKVAALAIADRVTDRATLVGAANLLIFQADGRILADNTDGYGFLANIRAGAPGWSAGSGPVAVLGAGGAARGVIAALIEDGATDIRLANRTRTKAEALHRAFGNKVQVVDWHHAGEMIGDVQTLVNTTTMGMTGAAEFRLPLDALRPETVVTDIVYTPLRTPLLERAEAAGCVTVDGLGMLLHQAVPAFERFFGTRPEVDDAARQAVLSDA
ncbi:shikimate dehydrogenase [Pseudoroseicyclus aestuarii]|uniref:Shikimate dehydrogenase (NADP(+)) n=1 Tax=Pseudoroseicyclus aestuarii TaxID=1795041 RepID=A0A318T7T5_9RHOB|nr:shikimate dehydrogenase [Pseudoroseicyclus aestuarii]PYE84458.1 shikimate dehydrogenase [Pseudoroseicyclus aestuarii]